jgi:hypothetical protein
MMKMRTVLAALALAFGAVNALQADTLDSDTIDALERFYHHFDGDNWHNNDGWLDLETDPCDWHGIYCGYFDDRFTVTALWLPENNLVGALDGSDILRHVAWQVSLSNNQISGELTEFPYWLGHLNLNDNLIGGTLPEHPDTQTFCRSIYLARNDFEGSIPESWRRLQLTRLDLSGNRLSGSMEPGFAAITKPCCGSLNLADNQFQGVVPHIVIGAGLFAHNMSDWGGGINLCWNELEPENDAIDQWLAEHHVGGANYRDCLQRERLAIDEQSSGSWFDPARNGEGKVMHMLPGGDLLAYTFSFDRTGRQHWLIGVGDQMEQGVRWAHLRAHRGEFGTGQVSDRIDSGHGFNWRVDRVDTDRIHLERLYADFSPCQGEVEPAQCSGYLYSDRHDYAQLTRLAGTHCDNQHPSQGLSGSWFDTEREGEGFVVEVLENGVGVVYWFTYQADGSQHQAWMMGDGQFDGQVLTIDNLVQPVGGHWGDDFDASAIDFQPWGSLTMEFFDDYTGHIHWESTLSEYGSGDHPIYRLSKTKLAECD